MYLSLWLRKMFLQHFRTSNSSMPQPQVASSTIASFAVSTSQDIQFGSDVALTSGATASMWLAASCSSRASGRTINNLIVKQSVTDSELIWAMKVVMDRQSMTKFAFFSSVAALFKPFLRKCQTADPVMAFLHDDMANLLRALLPRFVRKSVMTTADNSYKLIKIDSASEDTVVNYKKSWYWCCGCEVSSKQ